MYGHTVHPEQIDFASSLFETSGFKRTTA